MQNLEEFIQKEKISKEDTILFKIQHKYSSGDITDLVCKNGKALCEKSEYFKTLIRNVSNPSLQAASVNENEETNFASKKEWIVHFGDEVDMNALRWIVGWIDDDKQNHSIDIESTEVNTLFEYLITSNYLQIPELIQKYSRLILKQLDESNFIPVWYNAKTFGLASLVNFIQSAFFDASDSRRIKRYGPYDYNVTVYELTLKCHKQVYFLASREQAVKNNNSTDGSKGEKSDQLDLTLKVAEHYTSSCDAPLSADVCQNLMQALYYVVRWLYTRDLPSELDVDGNVAMINVAREMKLADFRVHLPSFPTNKRPKLQYRIKPTHIKSAFTTETIKAKETIGPKKQSERRYIM